jgi:hypothetical protein
MPDAQPEPWLRGPIPGTDPILASVLHALCQAEEDLDKHTAGLSEVDIWSRPHGISPLGFHLRHIAGSLDRLTTYLEDKSLTEAQLADLKSELEPGADREALLALTTRAIDRASSAVAKLPFDSLRDARYVGRRRLETTVIGLAVHLAEHTQRHVGQAITLCNLIKALRG